MVVAPDGPASPQSSQASPQHSSDGARTDEMVVAEDGPTSRSPQSFPASSQHSLDGSTSSGYPDPYSSEGSSRSGNSWMLHRPARLSPNPPASWVAPEILPPPELMGLEDWSPLSPASPPAETPPDNAGFFNKNMMKKLKIFAGVTIVGDIIATLGSSLRKNKKYRDFQDS
ncbi:hypothetical protein F5888DRAFT_1725283 [Russula emetica]|nr:hypothetical protein F5888DRAFT_1725283 [Russula emetica]